MFNFIKKIKLFGFIFLLGSSLFIFDVDAKIIDQDLLHEESLEYSDDEGIEIIQQEDIDFFEDIFENARDEAGNLFMGEDLEFIDRDVRQIDDDMIKDSNKQTDFFDFDADPWDDFSGFDTSDDEESIVD